MSYFYHDPATLCIVENAQSKHEQSTGWQMVGYNSYIAYCCHACLYTHNR